MTPRWKGLCLLAILGPLLISVVARTLGWALLFGGANGVVNQTLMKFGAISSPLPFMFTETGVVIALAHVLMPFMVLAVSASLQKIDPKIEHAAASLGARPTTVLFRIVLPQIVPGLLSGAIIGGRRLKVASTLIYDEFLNSLNWPLGAVIACWSRLSRSWPLMAPGLLAACTLSFILSMNAYATPVLLGGPRFRMMGPAISDEIIVKNNWSVGAVLAFILIAVTLGLTIVLNKALSRGIGAVTVRPKTTLPTVPSDSASGSSTVRGDLG